MDMLVIDIVIASLFIFMGYKIWKSRTKKPSSSRGNIDDINEIKLIAEKPKFKELTQEQIDDIHSRGKLTPEEKVKEWEGMDLCAPGDAIGSAAWRCKNFENCHDCLVDYASRNDEYSSIWDNIKIVHYK